MSHLLLFILSVSGVTTSNTSLLIKVKVNLVHELVILNYLVKELEDELTNFLAVSILRD